MAQAIAEQKPSVAEIGKAGGTAVAVALIANLILYVVGWVAGAFPPEALTSMGTPVDATAVIGATLFGGIVATVGYLILTRILALKLARQVFIGGAVLAFIGMFFTPFGITNAPAFQIVLLELMHLAIIGALVYFVPKA